MRLYLYPAALVAAGLLGAAITGGKNDKNISPLQAKTQVVAADRVFFLKLEEIIDRSERIFSGVCTKVENLSKDPFTNATSVEFTFKIADGLKGVKGSEIKFKQSSHPLIDSYTVGEKCILFLVPAGSQTKLTAPVGLRQGRFDVYTKANAKGEFVTHQENEIEYREFINTVKGLLEKKIK